ncbi:carbohydrate binding family 9 domain-containing protein [Thalassotalea atypica]|uniref:carbohydrate binding family 9 domain-containing protein n=1 Tax=Thalassotalea atypica TaxID=2054316 RepID=UPI002573A992|nr:DUF5916 domain-containing protein [Thalassotalea atypica]
MYGFLLSLPCLPAIAQSKPVLNIPHTDQSIEIDGEFDEALWQDALDISLDIVNSPYDNSPAPVKTMAKIIENGKFIYVAFDARDPNPELIQAALGDRDTKWFDDLVGLRIDTLNKRRNSYNFFVNALGVQNDEIYDEINQEPNDLWDGIWHSYGKITEKGYQVEIAIPFSILNFEQSSDIKTWPFELMRSFPRDIGLRLSHVPLDRDNNCWVCQYPAGSGFKEAEIGKNITLTPALVLSNEQRRDIYDSQDDWHSNEDYQASLDLRWGITPSSLLNVTINPDFSTVESDAGQLDINETFSLFYDEKRPFFIENSEYFSSPLDLVYTRNIADPDYGAKVTGSQGQHNYGVFISHDNQTNFILSGNLSSRVASIDAQSHSSALRYRYDATDELTVGAISTLRTADDYHNYVFGVDSSYRFSTSDLITAQWLVSETQYPDDLFEQFCSTDCQLNEQVIRSNKKDEFTDNAFNINYIRDTEYWQFTASHESFGENFKADLGFIPKSDYTKDSGSIKRRFYNDDYSGFWQDMAISGHWNIQHNDNGEFIAKEISSKLVFDGPLLSLFDLTYMVAERVGLRSDSTTLAIDDNTERFTEHQFNLYSKFRPTNRTFFSLDATLGDKIDYDNNRLGDYYKVTANATWNITNHIELDIYHTISELDADNARVYLANLTDLRFTYHFDVYSYLKLGMVYSDVDRNPHNNPNGFYTEQEKVLETQLIYAYKLNPQTALYLGYSDSSYQDDYLVDLEREKRTFFAKFSYAWQP